MGIVNRSPNRLAIAALDIKPSDTVLELGFGPGMAIELLAAAASSGNIYGVDASPLMLARARRRNIRLIRSGRVALTEGSFERLPFPDDSIDKVLAVNVAYFWSDASPALTEARRVLRPGGVISIYATDAAAMRRWKFARPETHRTFDRQALSDLIETGGFRRDWISIKVVRIAWNVSGLIAIATKSPPI